MPTKWKEYMKQLYIVLFLFVIASGTIGCKKSDSNPSQVKSEDHSFFYENGTKAFNFCGLKWYVKESKTSTAGPGPNYWSANDSDVYVDSKGKLHMKIVYREGHWCCTEVHTASNVSYGTFNFVVDSGLDDLDPNVVLGLFTWDNNTYQSDANTEIDIEMSNWMEPGSKNLHYSVQPTYGPEGHYSERYRANNMKVYGMASYHTFTWTDSLISFAGYFGSSAVTSKMFSQFSFSNKNLARRGNSEGPSTDPVLIPKPSPTTKLDINLWLVKGSDPYYNKKVEVVISKIEYIPF